MIRKSLFLLAGVVVFLGLHSDAQAQVHFTATLSSAQENNPANTSTGSGTGSFTLTGNTVDGYQLSFDATVTGLTGPITASHFHNAAAGSNAGVVRGFLPAEVKGTNVAGVWSGTDAQPLTNTLATALLNGEIYINFHTAAFGGGEIRGQLWPTLGFTARMNSAQENNPNNTSTGTGVAGLSVYGTRSGGVELSYEMTFDGLTGPATAAHFHNAAAGLNGPVVRDIFATLTGNTASGVWKRSDATQPLTAALFKTLINGGLYLNVHTAAFGGGEVRGQIISK